MTTYTVKPQSNYNEVEFSNRRKAYKYARSITDTTNHSTFVVDVNGVTLAWWRWTPENGGRCYRATT